MAFSLHSQKVCPTALSPCGSEEEALRQDKLFNWRWGEGKKRLWGKGGVAKHCLWKLISKRFSYWPVPWFVYRSTRTRTQAFFPLQVHDLHTAALEKSYDSGLPVLDLKVSCEWWSIADFLSSNFTHQMSTFVSPWRACTLQVTS